MSSVDPIRSESEASKLGRALDATLTSAKWVAKWGGRAALVLTVATVVSDTVEAGPTQAAGNFIKDASFYSVTVEPVGFWYNRTYEQAQQGKLNPESPIGNYINTMQQLNNGTYGQDQQEGSK